MDFLDKAQDFLDRAQEKVADATTLAAWKANQSVRVKALDNQKRDLEKQIETATLQLGNGVYQVWKNRGGRDDRRMEELCRALDEALASYREVTAELAQLSQATYDGTATTTRSAGPPGGAIVPASVGGAPAARILPPTPRREAPPAPPPPVITEEAVAPPPTLRPARPTAAAPAQPATNAAPLPRAARPKPCPSCGSTVPADNVYCPQCGYMAR